MKCDIIRHMAICGRVRTSGSSFNSSRYSIILKSSAYRSAFDTFHSLHSNLTITDVYTHEELIIQEFTSALEATQNHNDTSTNNTTIEMSTEIQSLSNKHLVPLENVSTTNTRAAEQEKQLHLNLNITAT